MPSPLAELLHALRAALERLEVRWYLFGAQAAIIHGSARLTADVRWIPMLATLGVWRHVVSRFPLRYDPLYWGAVFPIGMYTVCTLRLAQAIEAPFLLAIPAVTVWVALAAWGLVFAGMLRSLVR